MFEQVEPSRIPGHPDHTVGDMVDPNTPGVPWRIVVVPPPGDWKARLRCRWSGGHWDHSTGRNFGCCQCGRRRPPRKDGT